MPRLPRVPKSFQEAAGRIIPKFDLPSLQMDPIVQQQLKEQAGIFRAEQTARGETAAERARLREDITGLLESLQERRGELLEETGLAGEEFLEETRERLAGRRGELGEILTGREERLFGERAPGILEALSGRDLLHSSAVGQELARERGRLGAETREMLATQALGDVDIEQRLAQQIQDRIFGIKGAGLGFEQAMGQFGIGQQARLGEMGLGELGELRRMGITSAAELGRAGIQRQFSLEDITRAEDLARELARIGATGQRETALFQLLGMGGGALLGGGAGATIGGQIGGLLGDIF